MSTQDNPYGVQGTGYGQPRVTLDTGAPAPVSAGDLVSDTTTAGFAADVIQESRARTVLVDFWAPWCGPCRQLTPLLEKAVTEAGGRVKLVKMNIDDHPSIAGQLGIQSIPAVVAFRDGRPVDGFMGAIPESRIREFIDRVAGGGGESAEEALARVLEAAAELRAEGDIEGAVQLYAGILQEQPDTLAAIAGLADALLEAGDLDNAREVLSRAPEGSADAPELAGARNRLALAEQVAELGDPVALERRLADDPRDHKARFDLALIENARGNRAAAADHLLAIVKADRSWDDDGARRKLLQLFEAWGLSDEATLSARRKLSSLMFS